MNTELNGTTSDGGDGTGSPANPYQACGETRLNSGPGLLSAAAMGVFVSLSAATILLSLFFGVLVAVEGRHQAAPFDLMTVYSQGWPLLVVVSGTLIIATASVLLGSYSARRMVRAAQRSRDLEERRGNMTKALRDLRDAVHRTPEAPP